jgi:hypothetical protein
MAEDKDPIVYRYDSTKGLTFPGIPAESLTQAQYDELSPSLRREVLHSGGWAKLSPKKAGDDGKKGGES